MTPFKILVVDDEIDVFVMTKIVLKRLEHNGRPVDIHYTDSGADAIEYLKYHNDVGLVLLDIVMETENAGYEVVDYLRNKKKNDKTSIYIRTGYSGSVPREYMHLVRGIDGYISKVEQTSSVLNNLVCDSIDQYYS